MPFIHVQALRSAPTAFTASPFYAAHNLVTPWALDDSKLDEYCRKLAGSHDYSAFVNKRARREQSNVMTVDHFSYKVLSDSSSSPSSCKSKLAPVLTVRFAVRAKGFRRSMVRNLIGFLVDLCRGQLSESVWDTIWDGTDKSAALVHSAPPYGLCMEHVSYD